MSVRHIFVVLFCGSVVFAHDADATKLYRCDGRVQYRPCGDDGGFAPLRFGSATPRAQLSRAQFPRVVKESFKRLSADMGNWRGVIEGHGKISLKLRVFRNGEVESERFMGSVVLPKLKTTTFTFNSSLPPGSGWTWKVVAIGS